MAARRKKAKGAELSAQNDPRAPLDAAALLDAAKPLLKELAADLLKRADDSASVTKALAERHAKEQKAQRTGDAFPEWRRAFVEQVAAAWLLSCVFVRTLEDRGLLGRNRIAGPGAEDSWKTFLQLAPSLSEREYLLTVFRELSRLPAAGDLFDARHNPVWLLAPSAEGVRKLLELFRSPSTDAPSFRFGGDDTRFLGDLYQDLSEDVRKRYALLQTPRFVERFILDRTLDSAIERFGLDDTTLIDPTCGSGHFLLGAFERLFDARLRKEPGLTARDAATKALDAIAGADINPYAVAIARFRLTLTFVEKCSIQRLKDAPRLPLHLAVADSLLYNPQVGQLALVEGTDPAAWEGEHFALEDPAAARDVLFKQYAAVVGNPPYITVKDAVLRERYRAIYSAAFRSYSLGVPFTERFFQLGRDGAQIGMITANSFMKREFGKVLIEQYLPTVNLELIVNTSGAYIPGHGTPTVLLFGTRDKPKGTDVLTVLASRGEPATPEDAEKGLVWSSIASHWDEVGFENEYISVARVGRKGLEKHPWSLGGGGAGELKELLEERAERRLSDLNVDIGTSAVTREDDVFLLSEHVLARNRIPSAYWRPLIVGENVRDWSISDPVVALWPYERSSLEPSTNERIRGFLWPWRAQLSGRVAFGKTQVERGLPYTAYSMFFADRFRGPTIAFAFVATHNHFVLDRAERVFGRTAPIIKLPETATEEDHLALLAYLNSSTACFWMKQVMMNKGGSGIGRGVQDEAWEARFEFDGTKLGSVPIGGVSPSSNTWMLAITRAMLELAEQRASFFGDAAVSAWNEANKDPIGALELRAKAALAAMCALQEELDWSFYELFGLLGPDDTAELRRGQVDMLQDIANSKMLTTPDAGIQPGHRPFEIVLWKEMQSGGRKTAWFERNGYATPDTLESVYPENYRKLLAARVRVIERNPTIRLLEQPEYKRRWTQRDWGDEFEQACRRLLLDATERALRGKQQPRSRRILAAEVSEDARLRAIADHRVPRWDDFAAGVDELIGAEAVPYLAALRYSEAGLETYAAWEATWDLQRREDRGEKVEIMPPSRYGREDYASPTFWSLRGKLDVPKERFISYPGCESDEDKEPVYGWAGWDHLQRAVALAGLYQDRKNREGWSKDRLMPMLAGLLELLTWLKQWHNEPSADLGGARPSEQFEAFINDECAQHGWTHEKLREWRPEVRGRAKKSAKGKKTPDAAEE